MDVLAKDWVCVSRVPLGLQTRILLMIGWTPISRIHASAVIQLGKLTIMTFPQTEIGGELFDQSVC